MLKTKIITTKVTKTKTTKTTFKILEYETSIQTLILEKYFYRVLKKDNCPGILLKTIYNYTNDNSKKIECDDVNCNDNILPYDLRKCHKCYKK